MPELGPYGSVRGARGNLRPYRDHRTDGERCPLMTLSVISQPSIDALRKDYSITSSARGAVFGHGFHPLKARQPRAIPNFQSVHRQGRIPIYLQTCYYFWQAQSAQSSPVARLVLLQRSKEGSKLSADPGRNVAIEAALKVSPNGYFSMKGGIGTTGRILDRRTLWTGFSSSEARRSVLDTTSELAAGELFGNWPHGSSYRSYCCQSRRPGRWRRAQVKLDFCSSTSLMELFLLAKLCQRARVTGQQDTS